jgi:hypothetical protein
MTENDTEGHRFVGYKDDDEIESDADTQGHRSFAVEPDVVADDAEDDAEGHRFV